jgi:hypothetical protein
MRVALVIVGIALAAVGGVIAYHAAFASAPTAAGAREGCLTHFRALR